MTNQTYQIGATVLEQWTIKRVIGAGSFGRVYEIQRSECGQLYRAALKVISVPKDAAELESVLNEGMTQTQARQYFAGVVQDLAREIAIMTRLKGTSNVVGCEDHRIVPHASGMGWDILIRMELLNPLLPYAYRSPMSRRDIIKLGVDICRALELCQRYNVIHRDLKPENIFISDNGDYKLGDFGIARTIERTTSGLSVKGTYTYMAPEVYRGQEYGFSVDTYSLGLVLYRMLNKNRGPFMPPAPQDITHSHREQAMIRRMRGDPLPLPVYGQGRLGEIVLKACAFDPSARYASPQQLRQELEAIWYQEQDAALIYPDGDTLTLERNRYVTPEKVPEPVSGGTATQDDWGGSVGTEGVFQPGGKRRYPLPEQEKKKRPWLWVLALVVCAALAAGGLLLFRHRQAQAEQARLEAAQAEQERLDRYEQLMKDGMALCESDPELAVTLFEEAAELYPEEPAPCTSRAYALYCLGDYAGCIRYIEDDLALGKAYDTQAQSQLSEILGAAYFEQGDYAAAASFFRLSTAGGDITVAAQRDYAVSLGRLGDVDAADAVLAQMRRAGADDDVTNYVQAEVDFARKEYVLAEAGFLAVLEQTQDVLLQKRALRSVAEVYRDCAALVRTGTSPIAVPATKAVEVLSWGIETYGLRYDSTLWEMLGLAYFESYHTDVSAPADYLRKAGECFNRVIELGVVKDYLYSNLYTIYYEMQAYDLAEQALTAFESQFPEHYEPHAFRAMMLITVENQKSADQRDYTAAVAQYEAAGDKLRSDDDATYYQQLESLILQLREEGWIS